MKNSYTHHPETIFSLYLCITHAIVENKFTEVSGSICLKERITSVQEKSVMDLPQIKEKGQGLGRVERITVFASIQFSVCVRAHVCVREREERQRYVCHFQNVWNEISTCFLFSAMLELNAFIFSQLYIQ